MNIRRWITGLSFGAFCVAVVLTCVVRSRGDPCARLTRLDVKILRLSARPRPYRLSDHIVGLLHRSDPLTYYEREFATEKKALLASGRLVEFRLPYTRKGFTLTERSPRLCSRCGSGPEPITTLSLTARTTSCWSRADPVMCDNSRC